MGGFIIKDIRLHRVAVPLRKPFSTHLQTVVERESIFVELIDEDGVIGLGECVAFTSPWYTEETVQTCWDALVNWLIPAVLNKTVSHPSKLSGLFSHVKGNRMAKACLDQAAWDLYARKKEMPLWELLGGTKKQIDAGVVLTGGVDQELFNAVQTAQVAGYKRVKLKIDEHMKPMKLKKLVDAFSEMLFFADGNGIFTRLGLNALLEFDQVGLSLIEQPFKEDDWNHHIEASRLMSTPIALDESIRSVWDAEHLASSGAGSIIVLKPGRVGGTTESLRIVDVAVKYDLPIWIGGMIEFGVSKAHNLALASISQLSLPGDFSASNHFWYEEPVEPAVVIESGGIQLSKLPGIGVNLNEEVLRKYTIERYKGKS
ncbi:o-succinylbenzoate synthase [Sporosarcina sp. G11-34]|uniref:o-succinylbenzoate synthase n=1 Tax=Sporosarcina sp. G11-34 TaxID=2849605 RepID=UPI0022A9A211|nr:o-succinylbenzoate synthase [Sporosarcina sp. G11-34]MCZ2260710.1 o-succinylbenzoate synthase [Sporosarcina sp. G11-34]